MRIRKMLIDVGVEEKINKKHGVYRDEIEGSLLRGRPLFFKTRDNKYMAIGCKERYITIVFSYQRSMATIKTAYPSSDWQVRLYKKRRLIK